jgi:hypothetical protein
MRPLLIAFASRVRDRESCQHRPVRLDQINAAKFRSPLIGLELRLRPAGGIETRTRTDSLEREASRSPAVGFPGSLGSTDGGPFSSEP